MVSRSTIVGLAFSVAVLSIATWLAFRLIPDGHSEPDQRLLLADMGRYTAFDFEGGGLEFTCRQDSRLGWGIFQKDPAGGRSIRVCTGDAEVIQRFLDHVSAAPVLESVTEDRLLKRDKRARLLPRARLRLSGSYNDSLTFTFSTNAVPDGRLYVSTSGTMWSKGYKVVGDALLKDFPARIADFRDRHVLPYPVDSLSSVEIRTLSSGSLVLRKVSTNSVAPASGKWTDYTLQKPWMVRIGDVDMIADAKKIQDMLTYFAKASFRIENETPDGASSSSVRFNPDEPRLAMLFRFAQESADAAPAPYELKFGGTVEDGAEPGLTRVYMSISGENQLASVEETLLDTLGVKPGWEDEFREKRLFPEALREPPISFRIQSAGGAGKLFQREGKLATWKLVLPASLEVKAEEFRSYLSSLLALTDNGLYKDPAADAVTTVLGPEAPEASFGVPVSTNAPPDAVLEIVFQNGVTNRVEIAFQPPLEAEPDAPARTIWSVDRGPQRIVDDIDENGVKRPHPWDEGEIIALLRPELKNLNARIEAIAPASTKAFGLLPPQDTLLLPADGTNAAPRALLLGDAGPGSTRYAMVRGSYTVYSVDTNTLETLRQPAQEAPNE